MTKTKINESKQAAQTPTEAELHAKIEALTQQLVAAETRIAANRTSKQKFTTESCKNANTFHVSFSSLFSSEEIKAEFEHLFIRHDDETNTDVYKSELRALLIAKLKQ